MIIMNHQNKEEMIMSSEDFVDALSLSKNLEAEEPEKFLSIWPWSRVG